MIDFHTHVLPGIDDGSKDTDMSLAMLAESRRQGTEICIATPHFYGSRERIEAFLEKRAAAKERLLSAAKASKEELPRILVGAEVAYYTGISKSRQIEELCINSSGVLLLEMPFCAWTEEVLQDVETLSGKFHLILAHCERYFPDRENLHALKWLQELPLTVQINAHSLENFFLRRKILQLFPEFILGSDMHNTETRPPNLAQGRAKLPQNRLGEIDALGQKLLQEMAES